MLRTGYLHREPTRCSPKLHQYADALIDCFDKKGQIKHRFYRHHCTKNKTSYIKDLSKLGRSLNDIIFIDVSPLLTKDTAYCMKLQPQNGLVIKPFYLEMRDKELMRLIPLLTFLSGVENVRTVKEWARKFVSEESFEYTDRKGVDKLLKRTEFIQFVTNRLRVEFFNNLAVDKNNLTKKDLKDSRINSFEGKSTAEKVDFNAIQMYSTFIPRIFEDEDFYLGHIENPLSPFNREVKAFNHQGKVIDKICVSCKSYKLNDDLLHQFLDQKQNPEIADEIVNFDKNSFGGSQKTSADIDCTSINCCCIDDSLDGTSKCLSSHS